MTSIDSGTSFGSDLAEEKDREIERLRAELADWKAKFDKAKKRDIAFTNSEMEVNPLYN